MCHGVKQKAFYNLPEGQAALLQKFSAGQAKRLRHCDIKQHPNLLQWRQSQGLWRPLPPDYCINGPSSSPSANMSFSLGIFLRLPLLWHIFRSSRN